MGLITVEGIRVFAYHGHLPEEKTGGSGDGNLENDEVWNNNCHV